MVRVCCKSDVVFWGPTNIQGGISLVQKTVLAVGKLAREQRAHTGQGRVSVHKGGIRGLDGLKSKLLISPRSIRHIELCVCCNTQKRKVVDVGE